MWTKSWGYSGIVGQWSLEVPGGNSDNLDARYHQLIDVLKIIVPLLQNFHKSNHAQIDISLLGEEVEINGEIQEEAFLEDVEIHITNLEHLIPVLNQTIQQYSKFLITRFEIDLDTKVIEENKEYFYPKSALMYISTDSYAQAQHKSEIYISYSTLIDVWIEKTLGQDGILRDNSEPSRYNKNCLQEFLIALESNFKTSLSVGDSYYYCELLTKTGFL